MKGVWIVKRDNKKFTFLDRQWAIACAYEMAKAGHNVTVKYLAKEIKIK